MADKTVTTASLLRLDRDTPFWIDQGREAKRTAAAIDTAQSLRQITDLLKEQNRILNRMDRRVRRHMPLK